MQDTRSYKKEDHIIGMAIVTTNYLSFFEMLLLDPELQPQGGDVEGGVQVGGVGGRVHPLKTKVCHWLLIHHPANVRSNGRLGRK